MRTGTAPENQRDRSKPRDVVTANGAVLDGHEIGAARLPVSNVLPERELSVEAVMKVAGDILWPEPRHEQTTQFDDMEGARAREYSLLAMLLKRPPGAATLDRIARLHDDATPLGLVHRALAQQAASASPEKIEREYFALFIGIGRGELLPYASYYLTGFLNERPLGRLREDLRALGIECLEGEVEPEDHAATLCEIMAGMASGQFPTTLGMQQRFFEKHLGSWIGRFFVDLEHAGTADFYRHVGAVGRIFLETETEAFTLPARAPGRYGENT